MPEEIRDYKEKIKGYYRVVKKEILKKWRDPRIYNLERALQEAVSSENYEAAAELRNKITEERNKSELPAELEEELSYLSTKLDLHYKNI